MSLDYITELYFEVSTIKKLTSFFSLFQIFTLSKILFYIISFIGIIFYHNLLHKEFEMAQKIIYRKQVETENQNQIQKWQKSEMKVG